MSCTAKATQLKQPLSGYSSFWTGEYYEEKSQTYHHPSSPSQFHHMYQFSLVCGSSLFIIKPGGIKWQPHSWQQVLLWPFGCLGRLRLHPPALTQAAFKAARLLV